MNVRALVAEAVGTFILVGVGSLTIVSALVAAQGQTTYILLIVPFGFGLGLLAAIAVAGHVSGGHFNPAVTLAAMLDRRIDVITGLAYLVAQVVGAFGGSLAIMLLSDQGVVSATRTTPSTAFGEWPAFGTEVVLTAIFIAVILTITRVHPTHAVFVIPITLTVIHFAAVPISGASVNPARSLAPAVLSGQYASLWIYLTAPFVGAILGWLLSWFLTPPDAPVEGVVEVDLEGEAEIEELEADEAFDDLDDEPAAARG